MWWVVCVTSKKKVHKIVYVSSGHGSWVHWCGFILKDEHNWKVYRGREREVLTSIKIRRLIWCIYVRSVCPCKDV